jgi:hypothetical protein
MLDQASDRIPDGHHLIELFLPVAVTTELLAFHPDLDFPQRETGVLVLASSLLHVWCV